MMPDQEVNNPEGGKIDTQYNFGHAESFTMNFFSDNASFGNNRSRFREGKETEGSDEKKNSDHDEEKQDKNRDQQFDLSKYLKDLLPNPTLVYNFLRDDISDQLLQNANDYRILLLDCPDKALLYAASYAFINRFEEKYGKEFDKKHVDGQNLHRETSQSPEVELFLADNVSDNQLIVLDVTTGNLTQSFLESLRGRYVARDHAKSTFTRKDNLLLVKIDSLEDAEGRLDDLKECHWEVPFLTYLLKKHDYQNLEGTIIEQRKQGRWENEYYRFYHEIRGYIRQKTLDTVCESRDLSRTEADIEKSRDQDKETMRLILEKEKKPLRRYLIFLAAFFKGITDEDFDSLLLAMVKEDKKLLKDYNKGYKSLLQDCHIQRIGSSEDDYIDLVIEFSNLDYRDQAIRYFFLDDFHFIRTQCNNFLKQGFLLQKGPSYNTYRSLIGLLGRVSKASSGYGLKLLKYLIAAIVSGETSINISIPEHRINDIISGGLYDNEAEYKSLIGHNDALVVVDTLTFNLIKRRRIGYGILAEVIQEMSHHERLAQDLKQFYQFLIANKQHVTAFEIIRIMRHSTKVDKIEWIRLLIDNGEAAIKEKAFEYLVEFSPQNPIFLYDYLNQIHEWLPTRSAPNTYSQANKYALRFILEFSNFTFWQLKPSMGHFGQYPSLYGIFAILQDDTLASDEWLQKIIDWFCHPNIEFAWNDGKEEVALTKKKYYFAMANMLENWFAVLHGLSQEAEHPENLQLFDKILTYFIPFMAKDLVIYQSLIANWTQKSRYYEQLMKQAMVNKKESTNAHYQQIAERDMNEFAARRYLLLQKFIPTIKQEMDLQSKQH